jgi:C1A family cysteine protease
MKSARTSKIFVKEIPMQSLNQVAIAGKPRHLGGWRKDPPDHRDQALRTLLSVAPLPPWIDLSTICSPVEDQGYLGSCVANSSTSAMEALLKKTNRPLLNFSRLFVYYYTRKIDRVPPSEDSGCTIRSAMKCLAYFGASVESLWPYEEEKFSVAPSYSAIKDAKSHQILKYYRCPNLTSTKHSLVQGFTVVGGFSVPENMMSDECARTGIVKYPGPTEGFAGGHAIHFIGYNDQTKMLKFQNSWGSGWGDRGFGYLPYKFVEDGLSEDFWTIRAEE